MARLTPHYLRTDRTKKLKFDWWLVIDEDYIIIKEFLFISKIWSTSILLENGSHYVGHFLPPCKKPITSFVGIAFYTFLDYQYFAVQISRICDGLSKLSGFYDKNRTKSFHSFCLTSMFNIRYGGLQKQRIS